MLAVQSVHGVRSRQSADLAPQAPRERGADQSEGLSYIRRRGDPRRLSPVECPTPLDINAPWRRTAGIGWQAHDCSALLVRDITQPNMFQDDYVEVVKLTHRALSATDAPYCVIGALALGVWGTPRATYDVDLLILA